ncbi:hypothetical protein [Salmonella enterica]|uniref:hypothetical protein n=1 Tax=Salmonella enterica TaxID=28901 RepID=UPI0013B068D4|nr:hypothetical protein [Salmonella enterica]
MKELTEYGRTTIDRINFLINAIHPKRKEKLFQIRIFHKIWAASTGGSADINEHTDFFIRTNTYAL